MTSKANPQEQAMGCAVLLVLGVLVYFCGGCPSSSNSPSPSTTERNERVDAWVMAKKFVETRLLSPSSANYGGVFSGEYQDPEKCVTSLGDKRYRVRGWVDSQNAFGAQIRNNFEVTLKDVGGDRWECESITVSPR